MLWRGLQQAHAWERSRAWLGAGPAWRPDGGLMGRLVRAAGRVVPAELLSAREQAGRLIAEAEAARGEAERRGYQDGHAAGREAGLAEVTATLAAAEAHAEEVRARAAEPALRLARRMAEKIIGRAVELDPVVMADIVGRALAAARAGDAAAVL